MGFFDFLKGKKKDKPEEPGSGPVKRPSRRIIAPEGKPTGTIAAKPAVAPTKPATQRVTAKPGAPTAAPNAVKSAPSGPRPVLPPQSPANKPSGPKPIVGKPGSGPMKTGAAKPDDGLMIGGGATKSSGPVPTIAGGTTVRAKGRDPITAPKPLEFAGDLASGSRGGPARTGEQALIDFLINKARLLDPGQAEQVRNTAANDGIAIDVAAVQLGFLTEDKLVTALTQECWVPHLKVDKYEIRKKALDTISREDAEHYGVFPVDKLGSLLTLAMVNPLDTETIRVLESKTGLDIKKVVATRAEITQGIEKYYSGQVQAKEGSLGFVQDVEAKSVTQMISNVTSAKPSAAMPPPPKPKPASVQVESDNIVPEIEDIDELLSSDEVIAPAIIEPVSIKADEPAVIGFDELEPIAPPAGKREKVVESERIGIDELDEIAISGEKTKAPSAPARDDGLIDLDVDITLPEPEPVLSRNSGSASMKTPLPASDANPVTGALERNPAKSPAIPPVAPMAKVPVAPVAKVPIAPAAPAAPVKSAKRDSPSKRHNRSSDAINLIPVMEEEFQHAITHGRSHLFEKWVGLQTRNRIINGIAIEDEVAEVMASLFANGRRL